MILDGITNYILDNEWLAVPVIIVFSIIFLVLPIIIIWMKISKKTSPYIGIREIKRWSTIIFVPFFLFILLIVGLSISPIVDQIQSNDWVKTDATVDFAEERQDTCSISGEGECLITYLTHVEYIYEFDENTYSGNRYTFLSEMNSGHADEYPTGMIFSIFVDPDEPNESLMIKGWSGVLIEVLLVLSIFVLLAILFIESIIMFKISYLLQSSTNKQKAIDARTNWTLYNHFKEWFESVPSIHDMMLNISFLAFNRAPRIWVIVGPTIFLIFTIVNVAYISDSLLNLLCAFTCLILPLSALFTASSFEKTLPEHSHKRYKLVYDAAAGDGQGGWNSDPEAMELQAMARSVWIKKNSNSLNMDEALLTSAILDSQVQLDGGSRILNVRFDGQDGTIEVRNMNDILDNLGEIDEIAIIYLEDSKKMGRHLEFRGDDSGDDWYFHIREFLGEELILQESINMDQNHSAMIEIISNSIKSLETEDGEWWT